jgi:enoyl-CoA hydratase/carnithine racemase
MTVEMTTQAAAMPGDGLVRIERDGVLATIWLDRPAKRNAMTYLMWRGLRDACAELAAEDDVRVVMVRGAGGHFCAGADIGELHAPRAVGELSFMEMNMAAEAALASMPKPTIALIEGDCIGGGCAIAIDCDLRIATGGARFGITPARLGVVYPPASLERVVDLLGPAFTKQLLFTADLIDAGHAASAGLVNEVHPDIAAAQDRADQLVEAMVARSALTQAATKAMVTAIQRSGGVPAEVAAAWAEEVTVSGESVEGAAAFTEKRAPNFRWRPSHGPRSTAGSTG